MEAVKRVLNASLDFAWERIRVLPECADAEPQQMRTSNVLWKYHFVKTQRGGARLLTWKNQALQGELGEQGEEGEDAACMNNLYVVPHILVVETIGAAPSATALVQKRLQ